MTDEADVCSDNGGADPSLTTIRAWAGPFVIAVVLACLFASLHVTAVKRQAFAANEASHIVTAGEKIQGAFGITDYAAVSMKSAVGAGAFSDNFFVDVSSQDVKIGSGFGGHLDIFGSTGFYSYSVPAEPGQVAPYLHVKYSVNFSSGSVGGMFGDIECDSFVGGLDAWGAVYINGKEVKNTLDNNPVNDRLNIESINALCGSNLGRVDSFTRITMVEGGGRKLGQ